MAARHIARDRQAEANPAGRRIARGVEADERVKHPLEFGRWDARPVTQNCWLCNALVSALLLRFAEDSSLRGGASSKLAVAVEDAGVRHRRHEKIAQRPDERVDAVGGRRGGRCGRDARGPSRGPWGVAGEGAHLVFENGKRAEVTHRRISGPSFLGQVRGIGEPANNQESYAAVLCRTRCSLEWLVISSRARYI